MGCTAPILASLILVAVASGGLASAVSSFHVFAATLGTLMLVISALVAASEDTLISRLRAYAPKIKRASSYVLILVGAFNIYTAITMDIFLDLLFPGSQPNPLLIHRRQESSPNSLPFAVVELRGHRTQDRIEPIVSLVRRLKQNRHRQHP